MEQLEKAFDQIVELKIQLDRIELKLSRMNHKKQFMTIPEAAKHYNISEHRFRLLCETDAIAGCYYLMNPNALKKHYMIDTHKLDDLIAAGGIIHFQMKKYSQKK